MAVSTETFKANRSIFKQCHPEVKESFSSQMTSGLIFYNSYKDITNAKISYQSIIEMVLREVTSG